MKKLLVVFLVLLALLCGGALAGSLPESEHPYPENCEDLQTYEYPGGAAYLKIVFSQDTFVETSWDFIYLIDAAGTESCYTGDALSGRAIYVEGGSFSLRLTSDDSYQLYGYKVESVESITREEYETPRFTIADGVITGYTGGVSELEIPSVIDGQTVTGIGASVFSGNRLLTKITLPDTVASIGENAFSNCVSLTEFSIPDGVAQINTYTFYGCSALAHVTLPSGLVSIGNGAFYKCSALKDVELPDGLVSIDSYAFLNCINLARLRLPDSLSEIGYNAFPWWGFETVVSSLDGGAINALRSSNYQGGIRLAGEKYKFSFVYEDNQITGMRITGADSDIESLVIPEGVSSIADGAFSNCLSLATIDLNDDMATITRGAIPEYTVLLVSQDSPLLPTIRTYGFWYRIKETGETNVVDGTVTTVGQKVKDIVSAVILPDMTDYDKALALHNWLIFSANYDTTYTRYKAEDVLLYGSGVCQSYAEAYQLLLNEVGIENDLEYGEDHVWNMIVLDGDWYHVDVTWDDPVGGGYEDWGFFGVSNYALQGVSSHECERAVHIATAYEYNFYYRNGTLDERLDELKRTIESRLGAAESSFAFIPRSFAYDYPYGIPNRTSILVIRDTEILYGGKPVPLTITLDDSTNRVSVSVVREQPDFFLPAGLTEIAAESFAGTRAVVVDIPENVTQIGAYAFANCDNLRQVYIPANVTVIDENAFCNVEGLRIFAPEGSAAQTFALSAGLMFCATEE